MERIGDEFDAGAIGIREAHRRLAAHRVVHTGPGEGVAQMAPAVRIDRDRHMVQAAVVRDGNDRRRNVV
ncbi:GntR family transcriptional regulator [Streptomyces adustus]|uniref:GntR family transcriptional regulator n=1 Tax=Streptomyces adustus TaxID=1609272 RepID=A0A5N8V8L6_9ACTN|nr:GntR family transcriptional regulator [Streptomyces adustus]